MWLIVDIRYLWWVCYILDYFCIQYWCIGLYADRSNVLVFNTKCVPSSLPCPPSPSPVPLHLTMAYAITIIDSLGPQDLPTPAVWLWVGPVSRSPSSEHLRLKCVSLRNGCPQAIQVQLPLHCRLISLKFGLVGHSPGFIPSHFDVDDCVCPLPHLVNQGTSIYYCYAKGRRPP